MLTTVGGLLKDRRNEKYIGKRIADILFDVQIGKNFFDVISSETNEEVVHIELGNGGDAITYRYADGFSYEENPHEHYIWGWNLELVWELAQAFNMKVVVLKKYDCDTEWNVTYDFADYDCELGLDEYARVPQNEYAHLAYMLDLNDRFCHAPEYSKGLNVMAYFKDIEDATVFDTVDDVEQAYNEYTDNLKDKYAFDNDILLEELTKAQKGKEKIIEQVKHKDSSEFVMICNDDADSLEVMPKFYTMFYDGFNQVSYALGLVFKEE